METDPLSAWSRNSVRSREYRPPRSIHKAARSHVYMRTAASESASALRGSGHLLSLLAVDWKGDSSGASAAEAQCARLSEGRISPLPLADAVQALVASRDAAPLAVRALAVRVLRVHTAADSGMLLCLLLPLVQAIAHESHLPAPGPLASLLLESAIGNAELECSLYWMSHVEARESTRTRTVPRVRHGRPTVTAEC